MLGKIRRFICSHSAVRHVWLVMRASSKVLYCAFRGRKYGCRRPEPLLLHPVPEVLSKLVFVDFLIDSRIVKQVVGQLDLEMCLL